METLQERRRDFLLNKLNENNGIKEQINLLIAELKKKVLDPETITSQDLKNIYNYLKNPETKVVEGTNINIDEIAKQVAAAYNKVKQYEKEQTTKQEQKPEPEKQPENDASETGDKPEKTVDEKLEQDVKPVENNNDNNKQILIKSSDFIKALEGAGIPIDNAQKGEKLIQNLKALNINLTE